MGDDKNVENVEIDNVNIQEVRNYEEGGEE